MPLPEKKGALLLLAVTMNEHQIAAVLRISRSWQDFRLAALSDPLLGFLHLFRHTIFMITPSRMLVRAIGFLLVVISLIAISYPMLSAAIRKGKAEFLSNPTNYEQFQKDRGRESLFRTLPITLYCGQVFRSCLSSLETLCWSTGESDKKQLNDVYCLYQNREQIEESNCRAWLEEEPKN